MNEKPDNQLAQAMRALAAADAEKEATPKVEAALLAALRAQTAGPVAPVIAWRPRPRVFRYVLAAAALLLMSAGWFGWRWWQTTKPETKLANTNQEITVPAPVENRTAKAADRVAPVPTTQFARADKPSKRAPGFTRPQPGETNLTEAEIATEFFPLVAANALPERGRIVRVEMPRSTLINFGLPVNAERTQIPIKADLLLGEDGAARAIRFVQEPLLSDVVINVYSDAISTLPKPR